MKKIKFEMREVVIKDVDVILPFDCRCIAYRICFLFDDESELLYSLYETEDMISEVGEITNIFKILGCQRASEMRGKKLLEIRYSVQKEAEWSEWEIAGYGDEIVDKFVDVWRGDIIMTKKELEELTQILKN